MNIHDLCLHNSVMPFNLMNHLHFYFFFYFYFYFYLYNCYICFICYFYFVIGYHNDFNENKMKIKIKTN